ncbi:MAG TPA: hypothetical protein VGJ26_04265 [Pirellulales bacterium]
MGFNCGIECSLRGVSLGRQLADFGPQRIGFFAGGFFVENFSVLSVLVPNRAVGLEVSLRQFEFRPRDAQLLRFFDC